MGFLNKIKTSIGLKADEDLKDLNQATDNANTNISLQDSQIIKNLDQTDQKPTTADDPNVITGTAPETPTDNTIPQDAQTPGLQDTDTAIDLNKDNITTPITEQNKEDVMTAIPNTETSVDNPAKKLKSIKDEKERISNQLEKLTAEIDSIITNLEKEFTEDKKTTDNKNTDKDDTKNKGKKPIKKIEDTKKTEIDTEQPDKKDTKIKEKKIETKDTETQNKAKNANVTEKDLKELEEFLSKEKIKKMPKK